MMLKVEELDGELLFKRWDSFRSTPDWNNGVGIQMANYPDGEHDLFLVFFCRHKSRRTDFEQHPLFPLIKTQFPSLEMVEHGKFRMLSKDTMVLKMLVEAQ